MSRLSEIDLPTLRANINRYHPLPEHTWQKLLETARVVSVAAKQHWLHPGEMPQEVAYLQMGLMRGYVLDEKGGEYNKVFFAEGNFPGSMVALLKSEPSNIGIEAIEESLLLVFNYPNYRELLKQDEDLKWFHIRYMEENWIIAKEPREVALVQDTATARYLDFKGKYPGLEARIPQYHIASHLGVTPTQLSRIRKELK